MSKLTTLASDDTITVVLVEPEDMPPSVIIHWPPMPTASTPDRFDELAAAAMRVLAKAVTRYSQIRASRR